MDPKEHRAEFFHLGVPFPGRSSALVCRHGTRWCRARPGEERQGQDAGYGVADENLRPERLVADCHDPLHVPRHLGRLKGKLIRGVRIFDFARN